MPALTGDRATRRREDDLRSLPVKANAVIYSGAIACMDSSGHLVKAATALNLRAVGVMQDRADNTGGADGAISATVQSGVFCLANSASADLITRADINSVCYLVDDQTVAKTNGTNTRSTAGVVFDVDSLGVWVELGEAPLPA